MSKLLENVIASQLITYLSSNNCFDKFQSDLWPLHSTETALAKVTTIFWLLLTAVRHGLLLHHLHYQTGIKGFLFLLLFVQQNLSSTS